MSDISDLERQMLECDKKCAEHEITKESIKEIKHCLGGVKKKIDKLFHRTSWLMGILVFASLFAGYGLRSLDNINTFTQHQSIVNQIMQDSNLKLPHIIKTQNKTALAITKIQMDMQYMKKDINEIKKMLRK